MTGPGVKTGSSVPEKMIDGMPQSHWNAVFELCQNAGPVLSKIFRDFWGVSVELSCFAVGRRNPYFCKVGDFFVSQLPLGDLPDRVAQLRLSDMACAGLLEQALGIRQSETEAPFQEENFALENLTNFEGYLLTEFSKRIFSGLVHSFLKRHLSARRKADPVHVLWLIRLAEEEAGERNRMLGQLLLSVPFQALRLPEKELSEPLPSDSPVPDVFFYHAHAEVTIFIGQTRSPIEELQALESGDVLVLQGSRSDWLALVEPDSGELLPFTPEIRSRHQIEIPYSQDVLIMDKQTTSRENLWEQLMIDVSAEFFPFRLPLQDIKQMSEGLIVEIGDLIHNKVRLHVEGKTLAIGELVIVGDKFAIRVQELDANGSSHQTMISSGTNSPLPALPPGNPQALAQPAPQQHISMPQQYDAPPLQDMNPQDMGMNNTDSVDAFLNDDFDDAFEEDEW